MLKLVIPPPVKAEFPLKIQLVTVGLLIKLFIPPPVLRPTMAVFSVKKQLVTVGLLI